MCSWSPASRGMVVTMVTVSMSSRSIRHVCLAGVGEIQCLVSDGGGVGGWVKERTSNG